MQQRVEMRLAAVAFVVLGLWVGAVARQRWLLSGDTLATESAPVAAAAAGVAAVPDYYCYNETTGDCYAHYSIFGPGCDSGYSRRYVPCPTPTPTSAPPVYERRGTFTALSGLNVYAPELVPMGATLRMYFGGWIDQEDYGSDRIYVAESLDEGWSWSRPIRIVDISDIGGEPYRSHVNNPSILRRGNKWIMAFGGALVEQGAPRDLHDRIYLAESDDGIHWHGIRPIVDWGAEPDWFEKDGETWIIYCDRRDWTIDAVRLDPGFVVVEHRDVLARPGVWLGNPNIAAYGDGRYLVVVGCGCASTGDVLGWVTTDPLAIQWETRATLYQGQMSDSSPCGLFDASPVLYPWGMELWGGEVLWRGGATGECPVWEGAPHIVRVQYVLAGQVIPTPPPPPTPTPSMPACPEAPSGNGWSWTVWPVDRDAKLIVLGSIEAGTCYYLRRWTASSPPQWARYSSTGPWAVQGLYPQQADAVSKVDVFVPNQPNFWAQVVRYVYPVGAPMRPPWHPPGGSSSMP
jgi:hypothetical protein